MKRTCLYSFIILIFPLFIGCNDFLDVDVPATQYSSELVFADKKTTNATLMNLYADVRDKGFLSGQMSGFGVLMGIYADELDSYRINDVEIQNLYQNTLQVNSSIVLQLWSQTYNQIYMANAIIEGCEKSVALTIQEKNEFIGEALFVRALLHFYLLNTFGDIPYITTTDYEKNKDVSRLDKMVVYKQIAEDLERSISFLPIQINSQRNRPCQLSAQALLARLELYRGNWQEAEHLASLVINHSSLQWQLDINQEFLKENQSIIWQLSPRQSGNAAYEGSTYYFASGPPTSIALTKELVQFETDDLREKIWIRTVSNTTDTWQHAYKYKQRSNSTSTTENSVVFRLAEQFLIRAEAHLKQGNLAEAVEDINAIRSRAGLSLLTTTAMSSDMILNAIVTERKHELFCEFGHRFFDLKRMNMIDDILSSSKSNWKNNHQQWPIPEQEMLKNSNLTQNIGYE